MSLVPATILTRLGVLCWAFCRLFRPFYDFQDIKPKNLFLTNRDHVKIGDLGCSKLVKPAQIVCC